MVRSQKFCRQILHNPQILHDLSLPSLNRLRMQGLQLPMSYLRRTELTLQTLLPFRSRLPRMPRLMILGFENLGIKAFLLCGALMSIIYIFIEHPAQILGITILIMIMMIVLTSTWRIMNTFCLHLRILRELTLALILALPINI